MGGVCVAVALELGGGGRVEGRRGGGAYSIFRGISVAVVDGAALQRRGAAIEVGHTAVLRGAGHSEAPPSLPLSGPPARQHVSQHAPPTPATHATRHAAPPRDTAPPTWSPPPWPAALCVTDQASRPGSADAMGGVCAAGALGAGARRRRSRGGAARWGCVRHRKGQKRSSCLWCSPPASRCCCRGRPHRRCLPRSN